MMCRGCYVEYGSPTIDTADVRRAALLVRELYDCPEGSVGGNCHIVTEDWNLETERVEFCLGVVAQKLAGLGDRASCCHADLLRAETKLLVALFVMTEGERASALGLYEGFWEKA